MKIEKRKAISILLLLVVWAFTQYSWGSKSYAFLMIVFPLLLVIITRIRLPYFSLLAAFVILLVSFTTPTMETLNKIKIYNFSTARSLATTAINILTPMSGTAKVLPEKVLQMLSLLKDHPVDTYWLSSQLYSDLLVRQRISESAWPIKMEKLSPDLFILPEEEQNYQECFVVDQKEEVMLVHCPK